MYVKVAASEFKTVMYFFGIYYGFVIGLNLLFAIPFAVGLFDYDGAFWRNFFAHINIISVNDMALGLAVGIGLPLSNLKTFIGVGITRKQFAVGTIIAILPTTVVFTAVRMLIMLGAGEFALGAEVLHMSAFLLMFFAGWLVAVGFQIRLHLFPVGIFIIFALAIFIGVVISRGRTLEQLYLLSLAYILLAAALAGIIFLLHKKINIRC